MTNIKQKQMERLFCIETSLTNLYQKIMTLEKEGKRDTQKYLEAIEQLKFIKTVEMSLVQDMYERYGIEEILSFFEDVSNYDCLYTVLKTERVLDSRTRIVQLFLEYSYQDKMDLKPREEKVLLDEKYQYMADVLFLHSLLNRMKKQIEEPFYRENFITLKYNAIYTYPYLERYLFQEKINIYSLCFLYNMNSTEAKNKVQRFSEEEAGHIYLEIEEKLNIQENKGVDSSFALEVDLLILKTYLSHVSVFAFAHLHQQFKNLQIEKSMAEGETIQKDVLRKIGNLFIEVLDEKAFEEQEEKEEPKQYMKRDYCIPIEFYKEK